MDYFGINSAADLPKISEVFASQLIEPTAIRHTEDGNIALTEEPVAFVDSNGDLVIPQTETTGESAEPNDQDNNTPEQSDDVPGADNSDESTDPGKQ